MLAMGGTPFSHLWDMPYGSIITLLTVGAGVTTLSHFGLAKKRSYHKNGLKLAVIDSTENLKNKTVVDVTEFRMSFDS